MVSLILREKKKELNEFKMELEKTFCIFCKDINILVHIGAGRFKRIKMFCDVTGRKF